MPRPKITIFWREQVRVLAEQGKKPKAIHLALEEQAESLGKDDCPSETSVRRILKEHKARPSVERRPYALFRWPEAMESGELPWEASRVTLDLLRYMDEKGLEPPTLRLATWYWRVSLAVEIPRDSGPGGERPTFESLLLIASTLGVVEAIQPFTDTPVERTVVEQMLAYQPWRSATDRAAYRAAKMKAGYGGEYAGFDWVVPFIENGAPEVQRIFLEACADLFSWSDQFLSSYQSMAEKAAAKSKESAVPQQTE